MAVFQTLTSCEPDSNTAVLQAANEFSYSVGIANWEDVILVDMALCIFVERSIDAQRSLSSRLVICEKLLGGDMKEDVGQQVLQTLCGVFEESHVSCIWVSDSRMSLKFLVTIGADVDRLRVSRAVHMVGCISRH